MKRVTTVLLRAILASLLLVSIFGGVAAAGDGQNADLNTNADDQSAGGGPLVISLPEDPGIGP